MAMVYLLILYTIILGLVQNGNAAQNCEKLKPLRRCPPTSSTTPTTPELPSFTTAEQLKWPLWVTLSISSGRPNPSWPVLPDSPDYQTLYSLLKDSSSPPLPQIFGYRGFRVEEFTSDGVSQEWVVSATSNPDLETALFYTGLNAEESWAVEIIQSILCDLTDSSEYCQHVEEYTTFMPEPVTETTAVPATTTIPTTTELPSTTTKPPCELPTYDEAKWNTKPKVYRNNCYNYAVNVQNDKYAQPGHKSKPPLGSADDVVKAAKEDGLKGLLPDPGAGKLPDTKGDCLVALFYYKATKKAGADYHWMRRDKDENWSHKMDGLETTNQYDGKPITDPRTTTVDRVKPALDDKGNLIVKKVGEYKFIGFMSYCPNDIKNKLTRDGNSAAREKLLKKLLGP